MFKRKLYDKLLKWKTESDGKIADTTFTYLFNIWKHKNTRAVESKNRIDAKECRYMLKVWLYKQRTMVND